MTVNGTVLPVVQTAIPSRRHPMLDSLHRELGMARTLMKEVFVAGRRWLLRPHTLDDQLWLWRQLEGSNAEEKGMERALLMQAATVAIGLAAVGDAVTEVKTFTDEVEQPDPEDAEKTIKLLVERQEVVLSSADLQPPLLTIAELFEAGLTGTATGTGMIPEHLDRLSPPNPYREMLAEQVMLFLRSLSASVAHDLFNHQTRLQEGVGVPQVPLTKT
jgi:hypothetical protein